MNYSDPLISQVIVFFRSVGAGIILGFIYDALCFFRIIIGERKSVYVTFDIIFSITASVISFFFMVLYNTGQVRFNLMLGELSGGLAFHFSMGRYFLSASGKYIAKIRRGVAMIFSPLKKCTQKAVSGIKLQYVKARKRDSEKKNNQKSRKKFINIRKILLKNKNKSV